MVVETTFKVAVVPAGLFIAADVVPKVIQAGAETIVFSAAVLAGLVYLGKAARRTWRGARELIRRIHRGLDQIDTLPEFRKDVIERFDAGDQRFDGVEERLDQHGAALDVIALADRNRIKDAIAGDQRSPVDRRGT